ncbi:MAG: hypothetical protein ACRD9W_05160 [Terriglobia bacterium]
MNATVAERVMDHPVLKQMWAEIVAGNDAAARIDARANSAKHKLSRWFDDSRYQYWDAGKNGRNQTVRFAYSSHRNIAGYFLTWREVIGKQGRKRDQWSARKSRTACADIARNRYNKFIAKVQV